MNGLAISWLKMSHLTAPSQMGNESNATGLSMSHEGTRSGEQTKVKRTFPSRTFQNKIFQSCLMFFSKSV